MLIVLIQPLGEILDSKSMDLSVSWLIESHPFFGMTLIHFLLLLHFLKGHPSCNESFAVARVILDFAFHITFRFIQPNNLVTIRVHLIEESVGIHLFSDLSTHF